MFGRQGHILGQETSKPKSTGETLLRLSKYFASYWFLMLIVVVVLFVSVWMQVISPELTGQATDCYLAPAIQNNSGILGMMGGMAQGETVEDSCWIDGMLWISLLPDADAIADEDLLAGLGQLILLIIGLNIAGAVLNGMLFFLMRWAGQNVLLRMRVQLFDHLMALPLGFYTEQEAGDLMSRITNDMRTIGQVFSFGLVRVLSGVLLLVWISANMLTRSVPYALVSFIAIPFMVVVTWWFSKQARKAFRQSREEIGNVNAELQENIAGVREAQAFTREQFNIEQFEKSNAANRDANVRAVAFTSALDPILNALSTASTAVVVAVGGTALLSGQPLLGVTTVTLGLIITFSLYVRRFNDPIRQIATLWASLQSAVAGAERIFGLLDEEPTVKDKENAVDLPSIEGSLAFEDVHFAYVEEEPVLKGINFDVEPGKTLALVGHTGAGKTSIVNLIMRFWDVDGGAVKIDGRDIRDVTKASLRSQIGMVLQDNFLFSDTVLNNIRYGKPDATDEEVIEAAKLARADDFIQRLPQGYETVLGERGSGLSQGQRQLIAIARAALTNPRILILDEATSSVDTRTERMIQSALDDLLRGRTSVVIAHRLSTIRNADKVLVMEHGEIVERGTHQTLLEAKGTYYDLYMSQFKVREEELESIPAPEPAD